MRLAFRILAVVDDVVVDVDDVVLDGAVLLPLEFVPVLDDDGQIPVVVVVLPDVFAPAYVGKPADCVAFHKASRFWLSTMFSSSTEIK